MFLLKCFRWGATALTLCLLIFGHAAAQTHPASSPTDSDESGLAALETPEISSSIPADTPETAPNAAVATPPVADLPEVDVLDPFSYNTPGRHGDFVPYEEGTIPPGIEVVGIAVPGGGAPVAALQVPGHTSLFYVRKGDIVSVNVMKASTSAAPAARSTSIIPQQQRPQPQQPQPQQAQQQPPATAPTPAGSTGGGRSKGAKMRANLASRGLSTPSRTASTPVPSAAPVTLSRAPVQGTSGTVMTEEVLYIEVGEITDQEVELHPMTHPENVRILR